jgi:hypothetical protein
MDCLMDKKLSNRRRALHNLLIGVRYQPSVQEVSMAGSTKAAICEFSRARRERRGENGRKI